MKEIRDDEIGYLLITLSSIFYGSIYYWLFNWTWWILIPAGIVSGIGSMFAFVLFVNYCSDYWRPW